jgi:hypothetical protein
MSFADLKNSSKFGFDRLNKEIDKLQATGGSSDERFWKPEMDKSGNGYAVIRFLPAPDGEDLPWAKVWSHGFQGTGGWYIENSLTTLGGKDPVSELNRSLWNSGLDSDKEIARKQKRKLSYYANIYVVSDPTNPSNEGKVFLYKFGKKIFDKIQAAMQPEFQDETPINPFDFWQGANFKLKIRKVEGYWNYDKSEFATPCLLDDKTDTELEEMWRSQHSLNEFMDAKNFKSYEELESRLNVVLGRGGKQKFDRETAESEGDFNGADIMSSRPNFASTPRPTVETAAPVAVAAAPRVAPTDDDDTLSYFARLAEEDS